MLRKNLAPLLYNLYFSYLIIIISCLLSILVIYGIKKKKKLGLYSSIILVSILLIIAIYYFLIGDWFVKLFQLIPIACLTAFIFFLNKEKSYFG